MDRDAPFIAVSFGDRSGCTGIADRPSAGPNFWRIHPLYSDLSGHCVFRLVLRGRTFDCFHGSGGRGALILFFGARQPIPPSLEYPPPPFLFFLPLRPSWCPGAAPPAHRGTLEGGVNTW